MNIKLILLIFLFLNNPLWPVLPTKASNAALTEIPEISLSEFESKLGTARPWIVSRYDAETAGAARLKLKSTNSIGGEIYEANDSRWAENSWYDTNFLALRSSLAAEGVAAEDDLDAQKKWFDTFTFDSESATFLIPHATMSYWGILPHPPVFELTSDREGHSKVYGSARKTNQDLLSVEYQKELDKITQGELSIGNKLALRSNREVFDELIQQVNRSNRYILASNMFMTCDVTMEPLIQAVAKKIEEGVEVYQIYERVFALKYSKCFKRMKKLGVKILYSNEMLHLKSKRRKIYHNKFWIFDGKIAIVYGLNLVDTEVTGTGFNGMYRDTGVLVEGPMVRDLVLGYGDIVSLIQPLKERRIRKYIQEAQTQVTEERKQKLRGTEALASIYAEGNAAPQGLCRAVFQGPEARNDMMTLLYSSLIQKSKDSFFLSMIRVPTSIDQGGALVKKIITELIEKAKADPNYHVDMLSNNLLSATDVKSVNYSNTDFLTKLYKRFVGHEDNRVNLRGARKTLRRLATSNFMNWNYFQFSHQKIALVDRTFSIIGSYNLNKVSAEQSFEMAAMCYDDTLNTEMENAIIRDLLNSIPLLRGIGD